MSPEPPSESSPTLPPLPLNYARAEPKPAETWRRRDVIIQLLPLPMFVVAGMSGIGSDFVRIPPAKTISLTVALLVIPMAVSATATTGVTRRYSVGVWLLALLLLFTLWFWNSTIP